MYSVDQSSLVSAYGQFFSAWPWDHYATLTFARQLSESTCRHHWDEFINSLGRLTHGRVAWVRSDERRWSGYANLRFRCTTTLCSSTRMFPTLYPWQVYGSQGQETQRSRRTIVAVGRLITLRRCFRMGIRGMT